MPSNPKFVEVAQVEETDSSKMGDIDALLEKATEQFVNKEQADRLPKTKTTSEDDELTETKEDEDGEEASSELEPSGLGSEKDEASPPVFNELGLDELALVEQAGLSATEVQKLQKLPKDQRAVTLDMIVSRGRSGSGETRQEGAGSSTPQIDMTQLTAALIKPVSNEVIQKMVASMPGADESAVRAFAEEIQKASAQPLAQLTVGLIGLMKNREAQYEESEYARAGRYLQPTLSKQYEELKQEPVFKALVKNPATKRLVSAYTEQGMDLASAIEKAITDRAISEYGARPSKKAEQTSSRQSSLRKTSEPGERVRQGSPTAGKKFTTSTLDEALDAAYDIVVSKKKA